MISKKKKPPPDTPLSLLGRDLLNIRLGISKENHEDLLSNLTEDLHDFLTFSLKSR